MKTRILMIAIVWLVTILTLTNPETEALPATVNRVTSALQGSFNTLNSKRDDWLSVYTDMNNSSKSTNTQLRDINLIANMVSYLLWITYTTTVGDQKQYYKTIANEGPQFLPIDFRLSKLPMGPNLHLEAKLVLYQYQDFQVKILKGSKEIYFLKVNFNDRRAVLGHKEEQDVIEEVVLTGDRFPNISLNKEFRINVQIMDDCLVTTIWLQETHLFVPSKVPEKYIWCSRDYTMPYYYAFHIEPIDNLGQSHEAYQQQEQQQHFGWQQEQESQEELDSDEAGHERLQEGPIKLVSAVVYGGIIIL